MRQSRRYFLYDERAIFKLSVKLQQPAVRVSRQLCVCIWYLNKGILCQIYAA